MKYYPSIRRGFIFFLIFLKKMLNNEHATMIKFTQEERENKK